MNREVKYLLPAERVNMGGVFIKQALPTQKVNQLDPYLLLHHGNFSFNQDAPARQQGIGPHPHRGFSPVTFVIQGEIHHRDSRGNDQIASAGEVQWMHAGAGIIHSERPSQHLIDQKGRQEIIQLWINTPRSKKMDIPKYQYLSISDMVTFTSEDGRITNKLIAGKYDDLESSIETESELLILWSSGEAGGKQGLNIPKDMNLMIYVIKGSVSISEYGKVDGENLIVFDTNAAGVEISTHSDSQFLVLAGKPIDEKLVQQGPFVMNSETEILEAMRDYQMGKMGVLIED